MVESGSIRQLRLCLAAVVTHGKDRNATSKGRSTVSEDRVNTSNKKKRATGAHKQGVKPRRDRNKQTRKEGCGNPDTNKDENMILSGSLQAEYPPCWARMRQGFQGRGNAGLD